MTENDANKFELLKYWPALFVFILLGVGYYFLRNHTLSPSPSSLVINSVPVTQPPLEKPKDMIQEKELPQSILFHIDGAIKHPGVYQSSESIYLYQAVIMAGGLDDCADITNVNLSQRVVPGQKINIPIQTTQLTEPLLSKRTGSTQKKHADQITPVHINTASCDELQRIPGVGPALAQRIIDQRTLLGYFRHTEEIQNIKGMGKKKMEKIVAWILI